MKKNNKLTRTQIKMDNITKEIYRDPFNMVWSVHKKSFKESIYNNADLESIDIATVDREVFVSVRRQLYIEVKTLIQSQMIYEK